MIYHTVQRLLTWYDGNPRLRNIVGTLSGRKAWIREQCMPQRESRALKLNAIGRLLSELSLVSSSNWSVLTNELGRILRLKVENVMASFRRRIVPKRWAASALVLIEEEWLRGTLVNINLLTESRSVDEHTFLSTIKKAEKGAMEVRASLNTHVRDMAVPLKLSRPCSPGLFMANLPTPVPLPLPHRTASIAPD